MPDLSDNEHGVIQDAWYSGNNESESITFWGAFMHCSGWWWISDVTGSPCTQKRRWYSCTSTWGSTRNSRLDSVGSTAVLYRTGHSRLCFLRRLRSFNMCMKLLCMWNTLKLVADERVLLLIIWTILTTHIKRLYPGAHLVDSFHCTMLKNTIGHHLYLCTLPVLLHMYVSLHCALAAALTEFPSGIS